MAVRAAKQAIDEGLQVGLKDGLKIERDCLEMLTREGEMQEGAKAFSGEKKTQLHQIKSGAGTFQAVLVNIMMTVFDRSGTWPGLRTTARWRWKFTRI